MVLFGVISSAGRAAAEPTAGFPEEREPPPVAPPPEQPAEPPPVEAPAASAPTPLVDPYQANAPVLPPGPSAAAGGALAPASVDTSLPLVLPYRSGFPVPPGYHVESRPATGLLVTGALTLGIGYAAAVGFGLDGGFDQGNGWLLLPVAGPWAAIGARKFDCEAETVDEARECFDGAYTEATSIAVLAVDGMIQATGLVILIAGLASGRDELVRDDAAKLNLSARQRRDGGFDLGLSGRF